MGKTTTCTSLALILFVVAPIVLAAQGHSLMTQAELNRFRKAKRLYQSGNVNFHKQRWDKAKTDLNRTLEEWPTYSDAQFLLGHIACQEQKWEQARTFAESAIKNFSVMKDLEKGSLARYRNSLNPTEGPGVSTWSLAIEDRNSKVYAAEDERNNRILPEDMTAPAAYHFLHGYALLRLRKTGEARIAFQRALIMDPNHTDALTNLMAITVMPGQFQEPETCLDKNVLDPKSKLPPALRALYCSQVVAYFVRNGKLEEAAERCGQVCLQNPALAKEQAVVQTIEDLKKTLAAQSRDDIRKTLMERAHCAGM